MQGARSLLMDSHFNPRSHEGSDEVKWNHYLVVVISTRAPTRGATFVRSTIQGVLPDFNPRSHEGSDHFFKNVDDKGKISTRAPTRGATLRP